MNLTGERLLGLSGIYCAIHRETRRCYVGCSANIGKRLIAHLASSKAKRDTNPCFHKAIRAHGPEAFDFEILDRCSPKEFAAREQFFIVLMGASKLGFNITEKPGAPNYGAIPNAGTRERMSAWQRGRVLPTETRLKIALAAKLRPPASQATRIKISESGKGRKHRPETIARIAASNTGLRRSDEFREKMRIAANARFPASSETRAKIASANTGRRHSKEELRKMSERQKGRQFSDEHRAKISAAMKGHKHCTGRIVSKATRAKIGAANRAIRKDKKSMAEVF